MPLIAFKNNVLSLTIKCGKGTYIRSLARDIAYSLNTYAIVQKLKRIELGSFNENNCINFNDIEKCLKNIN